MTVRIRGFTFALSGTLTVPPGTVAGDVLVAKLRSFQQTGTDATPFNPPAGWTQLNNSLQGTQASAGFEGGTWGAGHYWRLATASEPASYTWTATAQEQIMGGMWAVYSDTGQTMNVLHSGTATSSPTPTYTTNLFHSAGANDLMLYSFCGQGTDYTAFSGFVNARTHHAAGTLHSDTPWTTGDGAPPVNVAQHRDIVFSLESEPGPFGTGTRAATANIPDQGGYTYGNSYVRITEVGAPPAVAGWTAWIID